MHVTTEVRVAEKIQKIQETMKVVAKSQVTTEMVAKILMTTEVAAKIQVTTEVAAEVGAEVAAEVWSGDLRSTGTALLAALLAARSWTSSQLCLHRRQVKTNTQCFINCVVVELV